jgi:flagellar biosynthesis protein FliQ
MGQDQVIFLAREALQAAFWVTAPILICVVAVSLLINILQVMTSIQDPTVSIVPRLAAAGTIIFFLSPWILHHLLAYTTRLLSNFQQLTR